MRILITGAAGFVGHHFIQYMVNNTDHDLVAMDKLTYASTWDSLRDTLCFNHPRVKIVGYDFSTPITGGVLDEIGPIDIIIHMGGETHVDRSISNPLSFVQANVVGTHHMLMLARELGAKFYFFSTDEVFGPAPEGVEYNEWDRLHPGNPYSATKAGAEMLVLAYGNTFGIDFTITRCMNIFGERQHPEKFIPLAIRAIMSGNEISVHADPTLTVSGSRFYIHAQLVAEAYDYLISNGTANGEMFHIVGEREVTNLELVLMIGEIIGKEPKIRMVDFHSSRPGHDMRYALDGAKLRDFGWEPHGTLESTLEQTVRWYMDHSEWLVRK